MSTLWSEIEAGKSKRLRQALFGIGRIVAVGIYSLVYVVKQGIATMILPVLVSISQKCHDTTTDLVAYLFSKT